MKIADHLSNEQKKQLNKVKSPKKKKRKQPKKEEKINWKEIMGHRSYKRVRGKLQQR